MFIKRVLTLSLMAALISLLGACGGGSTSGETGSFSLAITDGPIDSATSVVIEFTGVSIKPADGEAMEFTFDSPKSLDLLTLQGNASESIMTSETVPAGDYEWIRLHVNAERDGVIDSYIDMDDGSQLELWIPSGSETGLKLVSGFTVAAGGGVDFTIDFDLRKSITNPPGMPEAVLKPALRLVNNMVVGSVAGTVDATLVSEYCADASLDDGAVYIYAGADVAPADVQGAESDPLASALVNFSEDAYGYELGFLMEGDYTITYTCEAGMDDPEAADLLTFVGTANVTVAADAETVHDFTVAAQ